MSYVDWKIDAALFPQNRIQDKSIRNCRESGQVFDADTGVRKI